MGCCLFSGRKEEAWKEELKRLVEGVITKDDQEIFLLHLLSLLDEVMDKLPEKGLAMLAYVLRLMKKAE